ncbi:putative splicing factor, arginine/serine-rich 19-like [Sciurus carolinensis]|uniref:Splicing factor, arginine/serine-rich 19-like n=1 Tax=Sciurus carolinensis TaxID=30640 RepID=A0AA41MRR5_SCICA|nr:putative splicing factor, arginine/serine-rich 19-like [Sciurus carolinensis]
MDLQLWSGSSQEVRRQKEKETPEKRQAVHRVPARINDLTGRRSRAPCWVSWAGGEPGARGPAGGPGGRSLPRRVRRRRRSGNRGGARAAPAGGRAVPGWAAPQQGGGSPDADSGPRQRR